LKREETTLGHLQRHFYCWNEKINRRYKISIKINLLKEKAAFYAFLSKKKPKKMALEAML